MSISGHLSPNAVLLDVVARTRSEVLGLVSERAGALLDRDPGEIARALGDRERLGSTGVGSGVALPHADLPGLERPVALLARLARPVDWEAIDDRPVDLVVVVLSPPGGAGASLDLLARFARLLRVEATRRRLAICPTSDRVVEVFAEEETAPPGTPRR